MLTNATIFVDGLDLSGVVRTGSSRQFHRKSRNGCQRCRERRVKCNEVKPCCRNCERQNARCVYTRPGLVDEPGRAPPSGLQHDDHHTDEPEESASRRIAELELLHFYVTETGPSIPFDGGASHDLYVKAIPRMAFKSKALLYSMFAMTALHRSRGKGDEVAMPAAVKADARDQHQLYLRLAIHHHRQELSQVSSENADILFMTASLMRLMANFILSERELQPYHPPVEWLRIAKSHHQMYRASWDEVGKNSSSQISKLVHSTPATWGQYEPEGAEKSQELDYILRPRTDPATNHDALESRDFLDMNALEVYKSVVEYIGGILQSMKKNERFGIVARHLILFPVLVDERFITLVEESRPRAFVLLAHYFALLSVLNRFWFVGDTGAREVEAIAKVVPPHWGEVMEWPLQVVRLGTLDFSKTNP